MIINDVELKSAVNSVVTVGSVSEYDVKITECVRECNIDGESKKINSIWIGGTITIDVNGQNIKHSFRYLDTIRHLKNGNQNKAFSSIMTALGYEVTLDEGTKKFVYNKLDRGLTPKIKGTITFVDVNKNTTNVDTINGGVATRVKVSGKLGLTEGLNKDQSDLIFYNELPVSFITTTSVSEEDSSQFTIEGVVKSVVNELGSNGNDTGRYLVDIVSPNFVGVDVFNFVMLDKWTNIVDGEEQEFTKEDFYTGDNNSFCQIGDSVKISGDIEAHSFGNVEVTTTPGAKRTFGGGARVNKSGFTRTEWTIKSGDIMEEAYDNELIKLALDEREVYIDKTYKAKLEYAKNNSKSNDNAQKVETPKAASNPFAAKTNPFSNGGTVKSNPFQ